MAAVNLFVVASSWETISWNGDKWFRMEVTEVAGRWWLAGMAGSWPPGRRAVEPGSAGAGTTEAIQEPTHCRYYCNVFELCQDQGWLCCCQSNLKVIHIPSSTLKMLCWISIHLLYFLLLLIYIFIQNIFTIIQKGNSVIKQYFIKKKTSLGIINNW